MKQFLKKNEISKDIQFVTFVFYLIFLSIDSPIIGLKLTNRSTSIKKNEFKLFEWQFSQKLNQTNYDWIKKTCNKMSELNQMRRFKEKLQKTIV